MKRWLGLDPSISAFGCAVLERDGGHVRPLMWGQWSTRQGDGQTLTDRARRVKQLGEELVHTVDKWKPAFAVVEGLAFVPGASGHTSVSIAGRMRGLVEGIMIARGIPLFEMRPDMVKKRVTGSRKASKQDVGRWIANLFGAPHLAQLPDNVTDALAIAAVGESLGTAGAAVPNFTPSSAAYADDDLNF